MASRQNFNLDTTLVHTHSQERTFSYVKESYVGLFLYDTRYTYIDDKNYTIIVKGNFDSSLSQENQPMTNPIHYTLKTEVTKDKIIVTMKEFYIGHNKRPLFKSNIGGSATIGQRKKLLSNYHTKIKNHYNLILTTIENNIKD